MFVSSAFLDFDSVRGSSYFSLKKTDAPSTLYVSCVIMGGHCADFSLTVFSPPFFFLHPSFFFSLPLFNVTSPK